MKKSRAPAPRTGGANRSLLASLVATVGGVLLFLGALVPRADGQIPTVLTDRIYQGSGTINLLRDVSAANLQSYLQQNGGAIFGVDLNENLAGNETASSIGVAIRNVELIITTTAGTFTFRDFYTSTTAMILESGAAAPQQFHTLFGRSGSSALNGGTRDFDPSRMDDVLEIRNVAFSGTILSAQLNVTFLRTANTGVQGNESFFDFSNGPEDFALINRAQAQVIEAAAAGVANAPASVAFAASPVTVPGAPSPPLTVLIMLAGVLAWRLRRHA